MDTYDGLELARLFKPVRDALAVALVVCALFFHEELIVVILYIVQEHADHVSRDFLDLVDIGSWTPSGSG